MAELRVDIAGRAYRLGCEDGQEAHLSELAAAVDEEARKISGGSMSVPEGRLLVMCALSLADRLAEVEARLASLEDNGVDGQELADRVQRAAARLTQLAAQ
ncbi:MAG: cell division protein ZapA [Pseudomonadota bacterium]